MGRKKIICLTPVKNESWILDNFLKCAGLWADHIIVSDQGSEDDSKIIAQKYPGVTLVENPYRGEYNEYEVRNILFQNARKIDGDRIFIAVDADEVLSPEFLNEEELNCIMALSPGTVIKANFINIMPDYKRYWDGPVELFLGYVDDGKPYECDRIHTTRMISPRNAAVYRLKKTKVMHFQYVDWERMESKHRWYQCWERLNNPGKSAVEIYRAYHHMYSVKKSDLKHLPNEWLEYYQRQGVELTSFKNETDYHWDKNVLDYFIKYKTRFFIREAIWDKNWEESAQRLGYSNTGRFKDPRKLRQKVIHRWLRKTQPHQNNIFFRVIDKILIKLFRF